MTALLAATLAACGGDAPADAGAPGPSTGASPATGVERAGRDAVAAVLQSSGTPLASLWFELPSRPVAGQPFALKLLASAPQPVPQLNVSVESPDLIVTPAAGTLALPTAQEPAAMELAITGQNEGMAELIVRLTGGEGSSEAVYAIAVYVTAPAATP